MTANAIGWALLSIGILLLLRTAWLDRRLQRFRAPDVPAASYLGRFGRWRRDLYTTEGQALRASTRQAFALFCVLSLLGVLILESARP
jgi:hypothetical protein